MDPVEECEALVLDFFKGDADKAFLWFESPNPLLGMITPNAMIDMGREEKLLRLIKQQLAENVRSDDLVTTPSVPSPQSPK